MGLETRQSVLEIGCGWGGFAEFAAREVGAKVTGVTISREQYDFASERLFDQGLADKADIRLIDYRDVAGPVRPRRLHRDVRGGGRALLADLFPARSTTCCRPAAAPACRSSPSATNCSPLPQPGRLHPEVRLPGRHADQRAAADVRRPTRAGLEWSDIARFGQNYAETLSEWAARFQAAWPEIKLAGLRRAVPATVAVLPQLLRGRLRDRAHQCRSVEPGAGLTPTVAGRACPRPPFSHSFGRCSAESTVAHESLPQRRRGHRRHPPDPAQPRQRGHRLRNLGQGRVHEPRPVGQGPRGAVHHPRRRSDAACCGPAA